MLYAKAIYAAVFSALTAAVAIYTGVAWLVILLAAVTAVGVYIVPNKPAVTELGTGVDKREPLL